MLRDTSAALPDRLAAGAGRDTGSERHFGAPQTGQTLAVAALAMGRSDEALADLSRIIELDPEDASALVDRGETYQAMERYEEALADYDRAIELDATDALLIALRGQTYRAMGRYDQALADFDRAIELNPAEDEFAAARAEVCQLTGPSDTDDALPGNRGTTAT